MGVINQTSMKIISHRGNISGQVKDLENTKDYIEAAISNGFDVEVDLWLIDNIFYFGHDEPQFKVSFSWLVSKEKKIWIHCKNIEAIHFLTITKNNLNYFFHQNDDLVLTSNKKLWVYPEKEYSNNSIIVCSDINFFDKLLNKMPYGVCTDYPILLREKFKNLKPL